MGKCVSSFRLRRNSRKGRRLPSKQHGQLAEQCSCPTLPCSALRDPLQTASPQWHLSDSNAPQHLGAPRASLSSACMHRPTPQQAPETMPVSQVDRTQIPKPSAHLPLHFLQRVEQLQDLAVPRVHSLRVVEMGDRTVSQVRAHKNGAARAQPEGGAEWRPHKLSQVRANKQGAGSEHGRGAPPGLKCPGRPQMHNTSQQAKNSPWLRHYPGTATIRFARQVQTEPTW